MNHCVQVVHILSYQQNTVCFCGRLKHFAFALEIWCSPRFCPWPHSFYPILSTCSDKIREHNISYQKFADDTHLHKASQPTEFQCLVSDFESCFLSVKAWMLSNKLKLNDEKTKAMLVDSRQAINLTEAESIQIDGKNILLNPHVKNLGVFLDNTLSMEQHISHLCRSARPAMRQIASIRRYLTEKTLSN